MKRFLQIFMLLLICTAAGGIRAKPAQAVSDFKAFSWDDISNGKVSTWMKNNSDANGKQYSNYGLTIQEGNHKFVKKNGNTIDLTKRCDGTTIDDDDWEDSKSPYRYWFWIKSNKDKTSTIHWSTVAFTGTSIKVSNYDAYENGADPYDLTRIYIKTNAKSSYTSAGKSLKVNGNYYSLDIYVVDIYDWYTNAEKTFKNLNGNVYIQSITQIFNSEDDSNPVTGKLTTLSAWKTAATKNSFDPTGMATYYQHYNQWIKLNYKAENKVYISRITTTAEYPRIGDNDAVIDGGDEGPNQNGIAKKVSYSHSAITFENIAEYTGYAVNSKGKAKTSEGKNTQYYLKGIRIVDEDEDGNETGIGTQKFYILDAIGSAKETQVTGTDGVKTGNYSKKNGSGQSKNTVGGNYYTAPEVTTFSSKKAGWDKDEDFKSATYVNYNNKYLTGKQTWSKIAKYLENRTFKLTSHNTHIYLVYAPVTSGLTVIANYWTSDGTKYSYDDSKDETITSLSDSEVQELIGSNKSYGTLRMDTLMEYLDGKLSNDQLYYRTLSKSGSDEIKYTLKSYQLAYYQYGSSSTKSTQVTSDEHTLTSKVYDGYESGYNKPGKEAVTNAKTIKKKVYGEALSKLWDTGTTTFTDEEKKDYYFVNADFSKDCTLVLNFYEPTTPATAIAIREVYNSYTGKTSYELIDEGWEGSCSGDYVAYNAHGDGATTVMNGATISYSAPGDSYTPSGGYYIRKKSTESYFCTATDVAGYFGKTSNGIPNGAKRACSTARSSGVSDSSGEVVRNGAIAVFIYYYEIYQTPSKPYDEYSNINVHWYGTVAKNGVVPARDSADWTEMRDTDVSSIYDAKWRYSKYIGWYKVYTSQYKHKSLTIPATIAMGDEVSGEIYSSYNYITGTSKLSNGFGAGTYDLYWDSWEHSTTDIYIYYVAYDDIDLPDVEKTETTETFTWDDTEGLGGSSWSTATETIASILPDLQGDIQGDTVQELYEIITDPTIGSSGEILLPNGTNSGGVYTANTLKTESSCTSYLSRGTITRHITHYDITFAFIKQSGNSSSAFTSVRSVQTKVGLDIVWYSLDELEIWEPNGSRIYNYAFTEGAQSSDVRSPDNYDSSLDNYYDTLTFNGGSWDWGTAKTGIAGCVDDIETSDLKIYLDASTNSATLTDAELLEEAASYLTCNLQSWVTEHITATSDYLEFEAPSWNLDMGTDVGDDNGITESSSMYDASEDEDCEVLEEDDYDYDDDGDEEIVEFDESDDGDEVSGILLHETMVAYSVTSSLFSSETEGAELNVLDSGVDTVYTYDYLTGLTLDDLRIPIPNAANRADLFSDSGIEIPQEKLNTGSDGSNPSPYSSLTIKYKSIYTIGCTGGDRYYSTDNVNQVTLHTPIAMTVTVKESETELLQNSADYVSENLMIALGTPFTLEMDYVGNFDGIYGEVDTEKYALEARKAYLVFNYDTWVKYPAGTLIHYADGSTKTCKKETVVYYNASEDEVKVEDLESCTFYAAYWAGEGNNAIDVIVEALNTYSSGNSGGILPKHDCQENDLNLSRDNYCARTQVYMELIGRLFGLRQYDVSDYPTLQSVFRDGDSYTKTGNVIATLYDFLGNKYNTSGIDYVTSSSGTVKTSGTYTIYDNATSSVGTWPIVTNESIGDVSYGAYKTGYVVRYNVTTLGSLTDKGDSLNITPTFYWISHNLLGQQVVKEVKVYYDENVNGTYTNLVEVGSELDQANWHQMSIGDYSQDVDGYSLINTAEVQGWSSVTELAELVSDAWQYGKISLPSNMAVCEGAQYLSWITTASDGTSLSDSTTVTGIPNEVTWDEYNSCLQTWYGEYYLPDDIHVREVSAAYDAQFEADAASGYDFTEDYWLADGYLVVNFDISTSNNGVAHLEYDASDNGSNGLDMYKLESTGTLTDFLNKKKGDWLKTFTFGEGDFILYDLSASMSSDYRSGGTH